MGTSLDLIFRLKRRTPIKEWPANEAAQLLAETARSTGRREIRHRLLTNLGCLIVEADAGFLECLAEDPRVESVMLSKTKDGPKLIEPKKQSPPRADGWRSPD